MSSSTSDKGTLIAATSDAISAWQADTAKLWLYHVSLKRVVVALLRAGSSQVAYVMGVGCVSLSGPTSWIPAATLVDDVIHNGLPMTRFRDEPAGFEMLCKSMWIVHGRGAVPPDPFGEFFADAEKT